MAVPSLPRPAVNSQPYRVPADHAWICEKAALYHRLLPSERVAGSRLLDLRRYAREQGWDAAGPYVDGKAGESRARRALSRLMADAARGRFDLVVVRRLDRFAGSAREAVLALDRLRNLGVDFVSLEERIDTSGKYGEALHGLIGGLARLERDLRGRVEARQKPGRGPGRPRIEFDLAEVRRLRDKGLSLRAIARRLGISKSTVARALRSD